MTGISKVDPPDCRMVNTGDERSIQSSADRNASLESTNAATKSNLNIDKFLERLVNIGKPGTGFTTTIAEHEITELLVEMKHLFHRQPMMLEIKAPLTICGDIHGQFGDLMRIFNSVGFPPTVNFLFLGDYIDRGLWSLETILLLFCIKYKYPENFHMLRGNHETRLVSRIYGFYEDITKRWGKPILWESFNDVFDMMPLSALVSGRILCMHGGLSAELLASPTLDVLNKPTRPQHDPPNPSLALDLLWSDPHIRTKGFKSNIRGCSCTFGPDVVSQVCEKFKIDLIVRAHQVVQDGYEFFANRKLVTLFSAPHYCGQFDNAAAVMNITNELCCSFKILRPIFPGRVVVAKPTDVTCYKQL
ncbi:unnamed protein product [Caenorhabditis auriculariae]|uniref:Serine/threonine-protein phosphatase n=1 Tax=Caenorhabditis auriculariae TaxID=2777116 RepID=A0A8S1H8Q6_9PELO|nr:unnamed protein product [Caenorhabditis auriculariae]